MRNYAYLIIGFTLLSIYCNGCKQATEPEPDPLILNLVPTHVSVSGGSDGSIDLTVSGGTSPYHYQWSNGETTEDVNNLIADTYTVTVTDESDQTETDSIVVTEPANPSDVTITDYDGNIYSTVVIGNQLWLAENWKCTHAQDGSTLNGVYAYNDDENYVAEYGRLYTWQAALNTEPQGWHLPSGEEWDELINAVGLNPANKLIVGGNTGFNAKFGGRRLDSGEYGYIGEIGIYWTSTQSDATHARVELFPLGESNIITDNTPLMGAKSVRYIKD